jgi:branched-subunit amino acid transport protein
MTLSQPVIWGIIAALGLGTFGLRYSFLGMIGRRQLPDWALRLLRYTPVAVIPGLMAPQIFAPAENGAPDPTYLAVAAVTIAVGVWRKNVILAMLAGAAMLTVLTLLA